MGNDRQVINDAWNIYQAGYGNSMLGRIDAKTYFTRLRDAVVEEYKIQGFCELINILIENKVHLEAIAYSSLNDANQLLSGLPKADSERYIPYIVIPGLIHNQQIAWSDWSAYEHQNSSIYSFQNIYVVLSRTRKAGQNYHVNFLKKEQQSNVRQEETKIMEVQRQAETAIEEAKRQGEIIVAEAQKQAEAMIEDAKIKADKTVAGAKLEAEKMKSEAQANSHKNNRTDTARTLSKEMVQMFLKQERDELKKSIEDDLNVALDKNRKALGQAEAIHNDLCDKTNDLQAAWVKTLSTAIEELSSIKEDFYGHLHRWQVSLYPHELRPLAERYVELYHIVNVDKLIAGELLQLESDKSSSPTMEGLKKLNKTLTTFLRKFELSLNGLDLYVFYPESGSRFDEVWHVLEDDSNFDDTKDYKIKGCMVPGVAKKINDSSEDDVVIQAVVSV